MITEGAFQVLTIIMGMAMDTVMGTDTVMAMDTVMGTTPIRINGIKESAEDSSQGFARNHSST